MIRLDIKPLSTNEAWQGRRFKTDKYKAFTRSMMLLLPNRKDVVAPSILTVRFGFSSPLADIDNPLKMLIDSLATKYGFNDRCIKELHVYSELVPKGGEFIEFEF